ncbi:MAG: hypothetical protein K2W78_11145 [Xanthobacteraceae bacterium]|nr:hypothetical protein [Xanthobacteraceae bacterium]
MNQFLKLLNQRASVLIQNVQLPILKLHELIQYLQFLNREPQRLIQDPCAINGLPKKTINGVQVFHDEVNGPGGALVMNEAHKSLATAKPKVSPSV